MTARVLLLVCAVLAALQQPAQRPGARGGRTRHPAAAARCPSPAVWAAVRDSAWPRLAHADGDSAWAHLEPDSLPGTTATWCNPLDVRRSAQAAGRSLYVQYCATCHGAAGHGAARAGGAPPPSDFAAAAFAGMREPPGPAVLYAVVARGIAGTAMRAFGELSAWERLAVLAYITRFPGDSAVAAQKAWADTLKARRPH